MYDCSPPRRMRHSYEARCRVVQRVLAGATPQAAAAACGVGRATAYRLVRRYHQGGWAALRDRSCAPKHCPRRLDAAAEQQIVELRRHTGWGPQAIGAALGRPASTVWRVLARHGVSRRERQPRPPANRYEYDQVGALVHLDVKKLGRFWRIGKHILRDGFHHNRGVGWQHAHVAIDDHSRHAICELYPAEDAACCCRFLESVISAYRERGIRIERILTDNGAGYRSRLFADLCRKHHIRHIRTRPPRLHPLVQHPQTPRLPQRPTTTQPRLTGNEDLQLAGAWRSCCRRRRVPPVRETGPGYVAVSGEPRRTRHAPRQATSTSRIAPASRSAAGSPSTGR
jgi:transposase